MLNEILKEKLERLNEDELMLQAIRSVFSERVEKERPSTATGDDNELIGQKYRAYEMAREILEESFTDLQGYKSNKNNLKGFNKAR